MRAPQSPQDKEREKKKKRKKEKRKKKEEKAQAKERAKRAPIRDDPVLQKRWDHHLTRLNKKGVEDQRKFDPRMVNKLKKFWEENWDLFPETIRKSFLAAVDESYQTPTNITRPSNHKLWKSAVSSNQIDLDWGDEDATQLKQRTAFQTGGATKRMKERYPDLDILHTDVPETFPDRPSAWPEVGDPMPPPPPPTKLGRAERLPPRATTTAVGDSRPVSIFGGVASAGLTLPEKRKAGDEDHSISSMEKEYYGMSEDEPNKRPRRGTGQQDSYPTSSVPQPLPSSLLDFPNGMSYEEYERSLQPSTAGRGQSGHGQASLFDTPGIESEALLSPGLPRDEGNDAKPAQETLMAEEPAQVYHRSSALGDDTRDGKLKVKRNAYKESKDMEQGMDFISRHKDVLLPLIQEAVRNHIGEGPHLTKEGSDQIESNIQTLSQRLDTIATNTNKSSEQMEEKIKQQGGKIDALRTEVEALQAKIQTLEEANEQRIEEYGQLRAEVETLRARLQISDEDRQLRAQIEEELRCAQMRAAQTTSSVDVSN
ncbi:hypothetical protein NM208_g8345 [Fusarium decemcellulare]|uniref:Uncharacterized protein n=1 Tax=Fusarium decemcellulare TaxID=57161 RepID=A0ACC1S5R3_9HYPO|nr:hypothetical protein NM208_g8345 [Fusarium decemcellulare]